MMGLTEHKITSFAKPVSALADKPRMTAAELKAWFDANSTGEIKTAVNGIIDALTAAGGAGEIGSMGGTVQVELDRRVTFAGAAVKYIRLNSDMVLEVSADGVSWQATAAGGHVIVDGDGSVLPQRSRLRFAGMVVTDEDGVTVVQAVKDDGKHADTHKTGGADALAAGDIGAIPASEKGAAGGVASLGADGKVPAGQLPKISAIDAVMSAPESVRQDALAVDPGGIAYTGTSAGAPVMQYGTANVTISGAQPSETLADGHIWMVYSG